MSKGIVARNPYSDKNSTHAFSLVPSVDVQRSSFDRSFGMKTTFNSGYLVPILADEVLPGDTFNCRLSALCRLATPLKPFMDNLYMDTFFFFVPNRLLWYHWEQFNGAQTNPGDPTDYLIPQITIPSGGVVSGDLLDYMGVPIGKVPYTGDGVNAVHTRAYNLIYNEWFRDQNLQDSVEVDTGDGPDSYSNYVLLRRGKRHDYFTSCLPWPQKGPAVTLPLGASAPVVLDTNGTGGNVYALPNLVKRSTGGLYVSQNPGIISNAAGGILGGDATVGAVYDPNGTLVADLSSATASTINEIRLAFQTQKMYERDARGGTRYTEILRSHFGVVSPDARLQRPEYLGGGSSPISVMPVTQTGGSGASGTSTPQGNLAAFGTAAFKGHGFTKSFVEHGVIIGLVSVRADLTYQQGLDRMWSRQSRFDYYWPSLSHIGEQAVLNKEIYFSGTNTDDEVFGYQERYAEYRYKPSLITGQFRSTYSAPLDYWHLAQKFTTLPTLGSDFISENPPLARVLADTADPQFIADFWYDMKCARPMPLYGVPGLVDHF